MSCGPWPARLLPPWDSPGKNAAVGCHALLQGIFPTQGLNAAGLGQDLLAESCAGEGKPTERKSRCQCLSISLYRSIYCWFLLSKSCPALVTPWTVVPQAPRQESWSEEPYPPPGDLPHPVAEPTSPALQMDSSPLNPLGSPDLCIFDVKGPGKQMRRSGLERVGEGRGGTQLVKSGGGDGAAGGEKDPGVRCASIPSA